MSDAVISRVSSVSLCVVQHLLCLVLQAVACIALSPAHHAALCDADTPDTLMQLLLPSDEWYYTNHSTKYARYVKFHAARVLVYMGLFQRLGGRVDLFDLKRECLLFDSVARSRRRFGVAVTASGVSTSSLSLSLSPIGTGVSDRLRTGRPPTSVSVAYPAFHFYRATLC